MHLVLNIILPMFFIIVLGIFSERINLLGPNSVHTINHFVYYLAMPVLIFGSIAVEPIVNIKNYQYLCGFTLSMFVTFCISLIIFKIWNFKEPLALISIKSLGACFPNAGYIGIPLLFALLGRNGVLPAALASVLAFIMVALSIILIELDFNKEQGLNQITWQIIRSLVRNPLIMSAVLGILYSFFALPFPDALDYFYHLLGGAAAPCALFAIGQTIARNKFSNFIEISFIASLKLILHPLLTFSILRYLQVTPSFIVAGTILAALPTGALKFMIAQRYHCYETESSSLILFTTIASILTLSVVMVLLQQLWPDVLR